MGGVSPCNAGSENGGRSGCEEILVIEKAKWELCGDRDRMNARERCGNKAKETRDKKMGEPRRISYTKRIFPRLCVEG